MGSSIVTNASPRWKMLIGETVGLEQGVYGSPLIFLFHFSVNLNCSKKQSPLIIGKKKKDKYVSMVPSITSSASRFLDRHERFSQNKHWTKKEP